jgi:hypothetical protein
MFLVLWEFEVKPGCEERFERVYGAGGDWDSLFRRDSNHPLLIGRQAERICFLRFGAQSETNPFAPRSGCKNSFGSPATRVTASAAR